MLPNAIECSALATITAPVASPPQYLNFAVATSVSVTGAAAPSTVRVYSTVGASRRR